MGFLCSREIMNLGESTRTQDHYLPSQPRFCALFPLMNSWSTGSGLSKATSLPYVIKPLETALSITWPNWRGAGTSSNSQVHLSIFRSMFQLSGHISKVRMLIASLRLVFRNVNDVVLGTIHHSYSTGARGLNWQKRTFTSSPWQPQTCLQNQLQSRRRQNWSRAVTVELHSHYFGYNHICLSLRALKTI